MQTFTLSALAVSVALACVPALAQDTSARINPAYLVDGFGGVVHNNYGECWRTSDWSPALATAPCDPVLMPPAVLAVVPAPKAAAPVAAPVAVAQAAPVLVVPLPQKVSFSGDALFAFDKSVLRPESRVLLDGLLTQLKGTSADKVTITGHTDRLGSNAYNQRLSERRALAVRDYLVSNNAQATSIEAAGMGETQPLTSTADCKGNKATAALIACLQPDRRVDVEMTGTQTRAAAQ